MTETLTVNASEGGPLSNAEDETGGQESLQEGRLALSVSRQRTESIRFQSESLDRHPVGRNGGKVLFDSQKSHSGCTTEQTEPLRRHLGSRQSVERMTSRPLIAKQGVPKSPCQLN